MMMFVKQKKLPVFKTGEHVCVLLLKKGSTWEKQWHIGKIIALLATKANEDPMAEVLLYEIPERFYPNDTGEEWSSLALLPLEFPIEMIILNRLDRQRHGESNKSSKTIKLFIKDLCPAAYNHFRAVLTKDAIFSFQGKRTFR